MIRIIFLVLVTNIFSAVYYVDTTGSDDSSGLVGKPWKTLSKVNSATLNPNDSVLFKRGHSWRGQLIPKSGDSTGVVTYADYGSGKKPIIMGSVNKSKTTDWTLYSTGVWRLSDTISPDVGNLIYNKATSSFGKKKMLASQLASTDDYYYDIPTKVLYIISPSNPASRYTDIELALRNHIVYFQNTQYVTVRNLALKYGAAHGFGGGNTKNWTIKHCEISYIGGGNLNQDSTNIRFGNGIEFWANASNHIVDSNYIWQIYDTGITNQSHTSTVIQENIYYRDNIVYQCGLASFEMWARPSSSIVRNIQVLRNTFMAGGGGWGVQRPDPYGINILLSYNEAQTDTIKIQNNRLWNSNINFAIPTNIVGNNYTKLKMKNNRYCQYDTSKPQVYLFFDTFYYSNTFNTYKSITTNDSGSTVCP